MNEAGREARSEENQKSYLPTRPHARHQKGLLPPPLQGKRHPVTDQAKGPERDEQGGRGRFRTSCIRHTCMGRIVCFLLLFLLPLLTRRRYMRTSGCSHVCQ
jgi:hypothetical protein